MLKEVNNKLLIDDNDINILLKYGINANNYKNIRELQLAIDRYIDNEELDDEELDELDNISNSLQERSYYMYTNK